MKVTKKDLEKSQVELNVELSVEEFQPYIRKGAEKVSQEVKVEGFRPGKAPFEVLKNKIGEMSILEEAARIAINKTLSQAIKDNLGDLEPIGQPKVDITKLAPENPLEYKVIIAVLPAVELGDYKKAGVKAEKVEIKDEEVAKMIEQLREAGVKEVIVERKLEKGDKAMIDIEMFLDNVPVDGGQGKSIGILIGSDHVVPGFDKQLIGAGKGDVREFALPYPEDHYMKNLAGKMVDFRVKVSEVYERQMPEVNDEMAVKFGLKSIEELRTNIRKSIESEKKEAAKNKEDMKIIDKIAETTKFGDLPQVMIENETRQMIAEIEESLARQGGKFDDYLDSLKKTRDQFVLELLPNAVKRVKAALVMREIAKKEDVKVNDAEIDEKIESLVKRYKGYEKVEQRLREPSYRGHLADMMINEKVLDKLREWNLEKKEKGPSTSSGQEKKKEEK